MVYQILFNAGRTMKTVEIIDGLSGKVSERRVKECLVSLIARDEVVKVGHGLYAIPVDLPVTPGV
jgi:hypothetical protein